MSRRDSKNRVLNSGESQRADGRYMYRYIDTDKSRKVEYSWRLTESDPCPKGKKKELSLREKEVLIQKRLEQLVSCMVGKMTLNELFDFYINFRMRIKKLKPRSAENYILVWNKNMRNRKAANMPIVELRKIHIINAYQDMLNENVGKGSITLINKNVMSVMNYAVSEDYIKRNYAAGCMRELSIYVNKREALTQQEQDIFLKFVAQDSVYSRFYWMFVIMIETACRGSEIAGLTWDDVDLSKKFININHQLLYESNEKDENAGKHYIIQPPKSRKGIRKIPLTLNALNAFKKQKELMFREGYIQNYTVGDCSGFVFLTKNYKLWQVTNMDGYFHKITNRYNDMEMKLSAKEGREPILLPKITAHVLRHTGCTRMAEQGMDIRTLQDIMGHESYNLIMKVYNHVDEVRMRNEIDKIDRRRMIANA